MGALLKTFAPRKSKVNPFKDMLSDLRRPTTSSYQKTVMDEVSNNMARQEFKQDSSLFSAVLAMA